MSNMITLFSRQSDQWLIDNIRQELITIRNAHFDDSNEVLRASKTIGAIKDIETYLQAMEEKIKNLQS